MSTPRPSVSPEQAARVARQNRQVGVVSDVIGAVLAAAALGLVYGGGIVATAGRGGDVDAVNSQVSAMSAIWPAVLGLFAFCALMLGEILRRGGIRKNPEAREGGLPKGSNRSDLRVLSDGWRMLWILVALAVAVSLLAPVIVGFLTGGWPHDLPAGGMVQGTWTIYGSVAFGTAVTLFASWVKKSATRRAVAGGRGAGAAPSAAWRFLLFRWRVDLWCAAVGGTVAAMFAVFALSAAVTDDTAASGLAAVAAAGALLAVVGILLGTQYWRTGEPLGSGESFA